MSKFFFINQTLVYCIFVKRFNYSTEKKIQATLLGSTQITVLDTYSNFSYTQTMIYLMKERRDCWLECFGFEYVWLSEVYPVIVRTFHI